MRLINIATRERLAAHHPEAATEIANLESVLDDTSLDPDLLELCANYFETTLAGNTWQSPPSLSELETACLGVCEQFTVSVSDMREEHIEPLRQHLNADDVYNFMSAVYLIEMSRRLDLTLERVLS